MEAQWGSGGRGGGGQKASRVAPRLTETRLDTGVRGVRPQVGGSPSRPRHKSASLSSEQRKDGGGAGKKKHIFESLRVRKKNDDKVKLFGYTGVTSQERRVSARPSG